MSIPIADGVMAATHKLVQQALQGHWQEVPKTIEQRRMLLDQLSATASPQDRQWVDALRQAMAESDKAVAQISGTNGSQAVALSGATTLVSPGHVEGFAANGPVDATLDMIRGSK
ncbi:MAG TPA: hypothetical protein VGN07_19245 [Steroidobacteraceae bacterium]|jgi:hypothetical protein